MHTTDDSRPAGARDAAAARGDEGETLALLVLWPVLLVAILVLVVHTFIIVNAQAEAEVAASAGLQAAWRTAANSDFYGWDPDGTGYQIYLGAQPHPDVLAMAEAAKNAVAQQAATGGGWRWWTPGAAEVQSDFCDTTPLDRPILSKPGWVRVVVSGEVFGPLAALWPDRLDLVYAAATGPAVLDLPQPGRVLGSVPASLPTC